ncbi:hypothetical protein CC86DRAFT_435769 [Ophiobolus disseminans]|uniref:Uncharacterized protein n=1 Tax=Ophiobolus disseminans TaxID=1469910 RepID=A0A6A7AAX1_9PLEO|nr:hypothetical protein CC86DRAFT_435769 [Ophiobolus disseminans]
MGAHAFKYLNCPRISPDVYEQIKLHTTAALRTIFSHVAIPMEMPEKSDYGDIDFLVSGPLHSPTSTSIDTFDWDDTVSLLKSALNTTHGRRGFLNFMCMYFAIHVPGHEDEDFWVQVDVKVCFNPEHFEWQTYETSYATNSKIIGSMVKPLGLNIDPERFYIRVEEMDEVNFPGSMIWISREPRDVLRIMGVDRRILDAQFKTKDELYTYFASTWLFNPGHFGARLAEENYNKRLEDRLPHWTYFIREWIPNHYPGYKFVNGSTEPDGVANDLDQHDLDLKAWNKHTRVAVRAKVFTLFPHIAVKYYTKRAVYVKELEEQRLRIMLMEAISEGKDGWRNDFPRPSVIVKQPEANSNTPEVMPIATGVLTPSMMPYDKSHTNYVGMWKKRFEKEDKKAENAREEEEAKLKAGVMVKAGRDKILKRLMVLNKSLGLVDDNAAET